MAPITSFGLSGRALAKSTTTVMSARHLASAAGNSSTSFFPTHSFSGPSSRNQHPLPPAPLWYTARATLNGTLETLEQAHTSARAHLFRSGLLQSVDAPLSGNQAEFGTTLEHPRSKKWKNLQDMSTFIRHGHDLRTSQYKKLIAALSDLEALLPYAQVADDLNNGQAPSLQSSHFQTLHSTASSSTSAPSGPNLLVPGDSRPLRDQLEDLLARFEQPPTLSTTGLALTRAIGRARRLGRKDEQGRIIAVGRRKESSARTWLVPAQTASEAGLEAIGQVLVNAQPLSSYFAAVALRTRALRPLVATESLGAFNIFALVKGGGLAAQSEALSMSIARALIEWQTVEVEAGRLQKPAEEWRDLLKRADLVDRDPRNVERKKTGRVKARKAPTWVKR
ncbi:37S ribosomal protein S9, mitochondrial [Microbotryomycetes sp. JL221]|nr:37S ribosomal protein S9, mitochondrial [Microbotryomycetes sp. JL221]